MSLLVVQGNFVSCTNAFNFVGNNTFHVWTITGAAAVADAHPPVVVSSLCKNECLLQLLPSISVNEGDEKHRDVKDEGDTKLSRTLHRFLKQQATAGKKQAASKRRAMRSKREFNKCKLREHTAIARHTWSSSFKQQQQQQQEVERKRQELEEFHFNGLDDYDCDALAFFGDCERMNIEMDSQIDSSVEIMPNWVATAPWNWAVLTPPASSAMSTYTATNNINNDDNDLALYESFCRNRRELLEKGFCWGTDDAIRGHAGLGLLP
jgi:hypothetical protein